MKQPYLNPYNKQSNKQGHTIVRSTFYVMIATMAYHNPTLAQHRNTSLTLEEVIVQAQKKPENIQDIPATVNAINTTTINDNNIFVIDDINTLSSGLSFDRPDARRQTITLRGITSDPDNTALAPISTYFNEQPVRTQEMFQSFYDIHLIEILRGPQGTLQGRTDPAGSVHVYSQRPNSTHIEGYAQQALSDNNGTNTQFGVSLPIIPKVLAVRIAGLYDENEGQKIHNITTGQNEQQRSKSGRITINWLPTDTIDASLTYQHNTFNAGIPQAVDGDAGSLITAIGSASALGNYHYFGSSAISSLGSLPLPSYNGLTSTFATIQANPTTALAPFSNPLSSLNVSPTPTAQALATQFSSETTISMMGLSQFSRNAKRPLHLAGKHLKAGDRQAIHGGINHAQLNNETITLHLAFDLGPYTLSSITGYWDRTSNNTQDRDEGYVYLGLPQLQNTRSVVRASSEELRLSYSGNDFWQYQAGLFYEKSTSTTVNTVDATGGFDLTGAIANLHAWDAINSLSIPLDRQNVAAFIHTTINLSHQTTLQVGMRWQENSYDAKATSTPVNNYQAVTTGDSMPFDPFNGIPGGINIPGLGPIGVWSDSCGAPVDQPSIACNATNTGILTNLNNLHTNQARFNTFFGRLAGAPGSAIGPELLPPELQSATDSAITGGIKLQHYFDTNHYRASHKTMVYAALDRSFRPSGVTITPTPLRGETLAFDEETSHSLELGFKSTLMEGSLRINGATFIQRYKGYQARADVVNWLTPAGNLAEVQGGITFNANATINGAELAFQKILKPTWSIGGGMAYIDGTFDNGARGPCNGLLSAAEVAAGAQVASCDISGLQVSAAPLWSGTVNTEYFIPLERMQGAEWYIRGVLSYKGEQNNRLVNDLAIADYTVMNLFTGFRSHKNDWDFSLWAKNMMDTERRAGLKNRYKVSFGQTNFRRSTMIAPRLLGMTLRYHFNAKG